MAFIRICPSHSTPFEENDRLRTRLRPSVLKSVFFLWFLLGSNASQQINGRKCTVISVSGPCPLPWLPTSFPEPPAAECCHGYTELLKRGGNRSVENQNRPTPTRSWLLHFALHNTNTLQPHCDEPPFYTIVVTFTLKRSDCTCLQITRMYQGSTCVLLSRLQ